MKKILFAVMAMVAIGFTSCGNKAQQGEATDGTEVAINVEDEANATISALTEQIEAKDATKLQDDEAEEGRFDFGQVLFDEVHSSVISGIMKAVLAVHF